MTSELTIIIVSIGGLILTSTVTLGGLILTQFRANRRDLNQQLGVIRSELRDAARERGEIRDRIARVEVSLGERIARVEVSLGKRIAQVEASLGERIARVEASLGDRISRVEGTLDVVRDSFVAKVRKVV